MAIAQIMNVQQKKNNSKYIKTVNALNRLKRIQAELEDVKSQLETEGYTDECLATVQVFNAATEISVAVATMEQDAANEAMYAATKPLQWHLQAQLEPEDKASLLTTYRHRIERRIDERWEKPDIIWAVIDHTIRQYWAEIQTA